MISSAFLLTNLVLPDKLSAQSAHEVTLARALFEEGVAFADKGDWQAAADRFQRAHALKPTSGIAFNWASALVETGKLTEASELLRGITRDETASAELKAESEQKLSAIAPRFARIKVHVDAALAEKAVVQVDDREWPRPVWNVAVPIDPGGHVAVARIGEDEISRAELWLDEGEEGTATLAAPVDAKPVVAVKPTAPASGPLHERSEKKPLYKSWVLWTAVGVAVAGGVVAAALLSKSDDAEPGPLTTGNLGPGVVKW